MKYPQRYLIKSVDLYTQLLWQLPQLYDESGSHQSIVVVLGWGGGGRFQGVVVVFRGQSTSSWSSKSLGRVLACDMACHVVVIVVGGGCEQMVMVVGGGGCWRWWWRGGAALLSMMVVVRVRCGRLWPFVFVGGWCLSLEVVVGSRCRSLCGRSLSVVVGVGGGGMEKRSHKQTIPLEFRSCPFWGTFRCKFRNPPEFHQNGKYQNK